MTVLRPVPVALATALLLALAGCGSGDDGPTTTSSAAGARPTPRAATTDVGGVRPFAASSVWNQRVSGASAALDSPRMIRLAAESPGPADDISRRSRLNRRRLFVNTRGWAPPVYRVGTGRPVRLLCRQGRCVAGGGAVPSELRLPDDASSDPGHDGWMILVDEQQDLVWDLWRARRVGDTISYQFSRRWRLSGDGAGILESAATPRTPSVRGSGVPLLAGLIRPQELRAGRIEHALAISVPSPAAGRFVRPASTTNGLGPVGSLPEGARLRLKADAATRALRAAGRLRTSDPAVVDPAEINRANPLVSSSAIEGGDDASTLTGDGSTGRLDTVRERSARAIVRALREYGAIVVDRADAPTLYAQSNVDYGRLLYGNELGELRLTDFEVVDLGRELEDDDAPEEAVR
ncbi:hypothetical protein SK069_13425 [Patulibacter brassicae]|uniref:Lipoprotein n=1 Tax=Patulibacter brassicae TaxID=1705717 RepID=A0ABU4VPA8_9ACTN|nr:hypothetical protein [Patulibacter brassicae]MDX8152600.1 hypothetical protein [Patulibacter brassicae]